MQHFLASHQGQDIPIKHLYVEYRHWIESAAPFPDVETELQTLERQGKQFRRIIAPTPDDTVHELCTFLDAYDIRTAYPLLLALMDANLDEPEWQAITAVLESYLLRRAVCNWGTKNYNRIFLSLTRGLRKEGFSADALKALLFGQSGESGAWPDDASFHEAWLQKTLYGPLNSPKLAHLYKRLNQTYMSAKAEPVVFATSLSIEHIMPQKWPTHWPIAGFSHEDEATPSAEYLSRRSAREAKVHTLGNLTLLTHALNAAISNGAFSVKMTAVRAQAALVLNRELLDYDTWDEDAITTRSADLFKVAAQLWQAPPAAPQAA